MHWDEQWSFQFVALSYIHVTNDRYYACELNPPIAGVPPVCCPYGYSQIFLKNVKIISVKCLSI